VLNHASALHRFDMLYHNAALNARRNAKGQPLRAGLMGGAWM
jgi:hypothetical protein